MKKLLLTGLMLGAMTAQAQSWVAQATKFPVNFGVDEMVIVDANTVWTTAYDGSGGGTYPKITSKTTNAGTSWTATTITGPGANTLISDISALDANTAWVITAPSTAGAPNRNKIYKTVNGGTSWTAQTSGFSTNSFGNLIYFWDANNGWSAGDPLGGKFEMYKTSNGGTTWTAVATAPTPIAADEYGLVGTKKIVGDNIWLGTTKGRIYKSTDRGTNWTGYYTPALDFGGGAAGGGVDGSSARMAFKDANKGLLIAVDDNTTAALYSTADGGATWDPVTSTGTWFFGDITYVPGTANTYVSTGANSAATQGTGSAYTTDGGLTWTIIDNIPGLDGGQRGKVQFLNATTGWCGFFSDGPTGTSGIFKFDGNLALATSESTVKSAVKVYPNPATDVVTITSNKEIKSVSIMDLSGKRVQSTKTSGQVNVSSLAKGTYILQVYYGNGAVENTKLIKK